MSRSPQRRGATGKPSLQSPHGSGTSRSCCRQAGRTYPGQPAGYRAVFSVGNVLAADAGGRGSGLRPRRRQAVVAAHTVGRQFAAGGDVLGRAAASRRPALCRVPRSTAALARPSRQVVPADRGHVRRVGLRDPPWRLRVGRPDVQTRALVVCAGLRSDQAGHVLRTVAGADLRLRRLRPGAGAAAAPARTAEIARRSAARPTQGAAASAFLLQCAEYDLGADAGRRAAAPIACSRAWPTCCVRRCNGATRRSRRCAKKSACWSCTRKSCRSASPIGSR